MVFLLEFSFELFIVVLLSLNYWLAATGESALILKCYFNSKVFGYRGPSVSLSRANFD